MSLHRISSLAAACGLVLAVTASIVPPAAAEEGDGAKCVPQGRWVLPGDGKPMPTHGLLDRLDGARVVMLGEHHDNPVHHRWELQTLAALYGRHPDMVIGLEMFPRRVQPALDAWVAGRLSPDQFLKQSDWEHVWSYDAGQYMPIFWFARMNRIPMVAVNLSSDVISRMREKGIEAVPAGERHGLTRPAPPSAGYLEMLNGIYHQHGMSDDKQRTPEQLYHHDEHFHTFVTGQLIWDRTMAEGLADIARRDTHPFVAGLMGGGHLIYHFGIPHQLEDLGIKKSMVLLPWDERYDCSTLTAQFADAVFGVPAPPEEAENEHPLLGVFLEQDSKGPKVGKVIDGSVAAATGIKAGDVFAEVAGVKVGKVDEVIAKVRTVEPGTWLPLVVLRDGKRLDFVAKFPPVPPEK